ncbi:MAG: signal peptide peptidase SppA [Bacteroides sp.]
MKDFFKYTLATLTGIILSGVIFFILIFSILIGSLISSADQKVVLKDTSVLSLKLEGVLNERVVDNPLKELLDINRSSLGLKDILEAIDKAKVNPNIKGIYLEAGNMSTSFASLEAIRKALLDFKDSGKFIVAYADQYSQGLYYVASVADQVHLNPKGGLAWAGLSAQPMFYTDLFKKAGVDMQIFKVGTYKSAVEPYTETKMSAANREQMTVFLQDIWSHILGGVSESRGISTERLNDLANQMMLFQPTEEVMSNNLVDKLSYRYEVKDAVRNLIGEDSEPDYVSYKKMKNVSAPEKEKTKSEGSIAVYYAEGGIVDQGSKYDTEIVGNTVVKDLKKLEENSRVKAVVLRVNSPGGSAYASEQIWKAVQDLKAKKPVVVSMGDYAASGGYYISAGADWIVAEPTTLTGSIGIFAMIPSFEKLADKVGLSFDVVKTNKFADFGSIFRGFNADERMLLQRYIEDGYDLFVKRCADGREMANDSIRQIAEGRVWTGTRALKLGLVDQLGGLDEAVAVAAQKAGISSYRLRSYPQEKSFLDKLLEMSGQDLVQTYLAKGKLKEVYQQVESVNQLMNDSFLQARMPYILHFNQ